MARPPSATPIPRLPDARLGQKGGDVMKLRKRINMAGLREAAQIVYHIGSLAISLYLLIK